MARYCIFQNLGEGKGDYRGENVCTLEVRAHHGEVVKEEKHVSLFQFTFFFFSKLAAGLYGG